MFKCQIRFLLQKNLVRELLAQGIDEAVIKGQVQLYVYLFFRIIRETVSVNLKFYLLVRLWCYDVMFTI